MDSDLEKKDWKFDGEYCIRGQEGGIYVRERYLFLVRFPRNCRLMTAQQVGYFVATLLI